MGIQSQIGMHAKPIVVFNVDGFFDNFLRMVDGFVEEGFVDADTRGIVKVATTAQEVVEAIEAYVPPKGRMKLDWEQDGTGVSVEEALA
jgi:predicted Rossmann-fold nucleotide-binding protein